MKSTKSIYAIVIIALIIFNCSNDSHDDLSNDEGTNPGPTIVTYEGEIKSIIDTNCTQCHGSTPTNNAPFSLTTYNQVKDKIDRIIARANNASNPMPPASAGGQLSANLRALIQQWKDDGLLEN